MEERVPKAVIDVDDADVLDLRKSNGKVRSSCDAFWEEVQAFLDEINLASAVNERRHSGTQHMPFATSLRQFQELVTFRLKRKYPEECPLVLSLEWIQLQFWPSNQYTTRALWYTGWLM